MKFMWEAQVVACRMETEEVEASFRSSYSAMVACLVAVVAAKEEAAFVADSQAAWAACDIRRTCPGWEEAAYQMDMRTHSE